MKPIKVIQSLNEEDTNNSKLKEIANTIERILNNCHADVSYVNTSEYAGRDDKDYSITLSCHFSPDRLSKYENEVSLYGTLLLDRNSLAVTSADLKTGSGPNVLNSDFISALGAIYGYIDSGYKHYSM